MKRTQIYIEESQDQKLARRAADSGRTKSELIRDALDQYLDGDTKEARLRAFREAVVATTGSIPRLPPGADYVEQLRANDRAHDEALERYWRQP